MRKPFPFENKIAFGCVKLKKKKKISSWKQKESKFCLESNLIFKMRKNDIENSALREDFKRIPKEHCTT